jgi:hypothetical protein
MTRFHRFGLLCATCVGATVLASPVFASRPAIDATGLPNSLGTTHFLVHYQSDPSVPANATQTTAGQIAAIAERAYGAELADGYAAPVADGLLGGDDRIDIYIVDLTTAEALGISVPDTGSPQTSGYILLDGADPENAFTPHTISHELFHLIQFGIWATGNLTDSWMYESTAEWMGYRATGYDITDGLELGPDAMSLDCSDPNGFSQCDANDAYANGGYSRWGFFEYLSEKFGASFTKNIFTQAASSGTAMGGLTGALGAQGTTLADTYNSWSTANMSGGYTLPALKSYRPDPYGFTNTGAKDGTFVSALVTVNHLATEYVTFVKGDDDDSDPCFAATLTVTVTIPAGSLSKPAFFWDAAGSTPVPLTISGNTATTSLPWDTCTWESGQGYLSLPNASSTLDAADFRVTGSLKVDTSKPVTATPPPDPVVLPGVIAAPSGSVAPTIDVFGPELLTLSADAQQVRLIVSASNAGSVQAQIGSLLLGTQKLRAGNNDIRFTIPKNTLTTLQHSAAAANLLTLTPTAANGTVIGTVVTRKLSITPATTTSTKAPAKKTGKKTTKKAPAKKPAAKKTTSGNK